MVISEEKFKKCGPAIRFRDTIIGGGKATNRKRLDDLAISGLFLNADLPKAKQDPASSTYSKVAMPGLNRPARGD